MIAVRDWLAPPANGGQHRVDDVVQSIKAGSSRLEQQAVRKDCLGDAANLEQFAEDLRRASSLIEGLGDELSDDVELIARHGARLQDLDVALQTIRAVAGAMGSDPQDPECTARLENVRACCSHALERNRQAYA